MTLTCMKEQAHHLGVIVGASLAEEEESLHENVRVEYLRLAVDLKGEGPLPVALVLVVESFAVVEGSRFEILSSFGYALLGKVLKFLPQQRVAPRDKRRLIFGVRDSWIDSQIDECWSERLPKYDCYAGWPLKKHLELWDQFPTDGTKLLPN
ncbi:hypothetical protein M5K25_011635 [Dendrobium thyrsiflorum]|uniref:Uncharacterized protein n=1 Tax=Dendrobium thyrsiflorum TaxID=117978 RepID=A0ABD0VA92_DENTH